VDAASSRGRKSCNVASFSALCDIVAENTSFWSCGEMGGKGLLGYSAKQNINHNPTLSSSKAGKGH
jgi:hypothetical protein